MQVRGETARTSCRKSQSRRNESSADAIFSKDLDGTIRTWNRGAERLYGYSRDEVLGRSVNMLVPEDRIDEWTKVMAMLARGEFVEQLAEGKGTGLRLDHPDGLYDPREYFERARS